MTSRIEDQLATTLGRSDEGPNIATAEKIAKSSDAAEMKELMGLLNHKSSAIRNDAIKVIYEVAVRKIELVTPYMYKILHLLDHKDNRMRWGAMTALSAIARSRPDLISSHLPRIVEAMDTGSVITRDHGIYILCHVSTLPSYHEDCIELLLEQIEKGPVNQVPLYAEQTAGIITDPYKNRFIKILSSRRDVLEIPSKQKRVEKLIKKLQS